MGEDSAYAVELARRSGDAAALSFALLARHDAIWEPATADDRLELSLEVAVAARAGADREMELQALLLEFVARLELGQDAALRVIEWYWALEEQLLLPRCRYVALTRRVTVATMQGRFDDAERYLGEAYAVGERIGEVDRDGVDCDQRWELARQRGDLDAIDDLVGRFGGDPHSIVIEVPLALERGDRIETERLYRRFHELGVVWPRWAQLIWWTIEAEVAVASGSDERCRAIRALLAPFADRWVVLGGGVVAHGPVAHFLAMLDAALGELDAAILGFERARMSAEWLGARPWVVHARTGLARTLLARDAPGDRADAMAAIDAAADEAAALGMAPVELDALTDADPAASRPARFVRDGDVWTLTFDGTTVRFPDAKGLRDIRMLIRHAGAEISALQLLAPDGGEVLAAARQLGADAVLDETARREYRARVVDLDERIAAALDRHDDRRAQWLDAERDALLAELQAATGLGGRPRRLGDEAERARKAVTARDREAVRRVGDRHAALGQHLAAAVITGSSCRYSPREPIRWET